MIRNGTTFRPALSGPSGEYVTLEPNFLLGTEESHIKSIIWIGILLTNAAKTQKSS